MSDQKLTADQIAGFEARAAAGERPVLEWCHWPTHGTKEISVLAFLHDSAIRIYWPSQKRGRVSDQFYLCFGVHDVENSAFASGDFSNIESAQLAAEHLLAEKTRPLHRDAYVAKSNWEATHGNVERLNELLKTQHANNPVCGDHWHGLSGHSVDGNEGCPWCHLEKKSAELSEAESALASRDGELAALRARVAKLETVSLNGLVGDYAALRARAEAAEARANIAETDFWRLKNEAAAECSRLTDRVAALEAALGEAREDHARTAWAMGTRTGQILVELFVDYDDETSQLHYWDAKISRTMLMSLPFPFVWTPEARAIVDAARAGGQGT